MANDSDGNDPLRSIAAGFTDSVKDDFKGGIKSLVQKLRDGNLGFIQERSTIDRVKEQLKCNEHRFYQTYVKDKDLQTYVVLGLTMRKLHIDGEDKKRELLATKIKNKHGMEALHIAYIVQNKVLSKCITLILENVEQTERFENILDKFLRNIEQYTYFVRNTQKTEQVADTIKIKIDSQNPILFVISGMKSAGSIIESSFKLIEEHMNELYDIEEYTSNAAKIILFNGINRNVHE